MDSSLEEEIVRLSRPPSKQGTGSNNPEQERASTLDAAQGIPTSTAVLQPQNGQLAGAGGDSAVMPPQAPAQRLRRGSSGSSSGGSLRSPGQHRGGLAAAVLAGNSISDLHVPATISGSTEQQQQQQQQRYGRPAASNGSGDGASGGGAAAAGSAAAAPSRPRLAANGEKIAGPSLSRPVLKGERMAGPSARSVVFNAERVAGAGGAPTGGKATAAAAAAATAATGAMSSGVGSTKGGSSKEEEAWKRSEAALKKKEQSVRNALKEKQRTLQQESLLLATVDRELAQLALDHQSEVNDLRKTLEVVDRELAFLDRDAQKKLEAFEKARTLLSAKVTQKHGITSRLTELIMASEKKRDAKLNEIMKKMSSDGSGGGTAGAGRAAHQR
ncbi:unnamed protein product [Scytosiphon promiscuus]